MVLLTTWDRGSRDILKTLSIISKLEAMGVEVSTLNQNSEIREEKAKLFIKIHAKIFEEEIKKFHPRV